MEAVAQNDDSVTSLIIAHLATETETSYKREAIRAVGMLGAARSVTVPEDLIDKLVTEFKDETEHSINMDKLESGLFKLDKAAMETSVPIYIADWILGQLLAIWERPSMGHLHFTVGLSVQIAEILPNLRGYGADLRWISARSSRPSCGSSDMHLVASDPTTFPTASSNACSMSCGTPLCRRKAFAITSPHSVRSCAPSTGVQKARPRRSWLFCLK